MADNEQEKARIYRLPVEWHYPEDLATGYSTNFIVQHREHEFYLSFFDVPPPLLLGTDEERKEQAQRLGSVRATAVARVIVAAERIPEFIRVLQENYDMYQAKQQNRDESEG